MEKKIEISAVVIVKNEEKNIEDCLKSLDFVDEIIVVDTGSTDKTIAIASKYANKIVEQIDGSFSSWRNAGMRESSGILVLHIDADERATKDVAKEIKSLIYDKTAAYAIPRRNIILGRVMKHGGWWPDYVIHLLRKDSFKFWKGDLHEEPVFEGVLKYLKSPLIHKKHDNLTDMVTKTNKWSEIEAKLMHDAHHPDMNIVRFTSAMVREFYLRMIKNMAFLDGPEGIIYALYQVFSRFVSYAKLYEMQLSNKKEKV